VKSFISTHVNPLKEGNATEQASGERGAGTQNTSTASSTPVTRPNSMRMAATRQAGRAFTPEELLKEGIAEFKAKPVSFNLANDPALLLKLLGISIVDAEVDGGLDKRVERGRRKALFLASTDKDGNAATLSKRLKLGLTEEDIAAGVGERLAKALNGIESEALKEIVRQYLIAVGINDAEIDSICDECWNLIEQIRNLDKQLETSYQKTLQHAAAVERSAAALDRSAANSTQLYNESMEIVSDCKQMIKEIVSRKQDASPSVVSATLFADHSGSEGSELGMVLAQ
jgi:hypothetical protein